MSTAKVYQKLLTIQDVHKAARFWYGKSDLDSCCLAENRLMKGEEPNYET